MAKKAITLTLLKKNHGNKSFALNPKSLSESNEYINILKRSLDKKGVIVTNFFFINDANTFKLKLQIFFKTQKLKRYRKYKKKIKLKNFKRFRRFKRFQWRFFTKKRQELFEKQESINIKRAYWNKNKGKVILIQNSTNLFDNLVSTMKEKRKNWIKKTVPQTRLFNIKANLSKERSNFLIHKNEKKVEKKEKRTEAFKSITKFLPVNNLLVHEFEVLNTQVFTQISYAVNKNLKYFKRVLFSRRITLYIDFLKMTALFITGKIKLATYNTILGTIFKFLLKKSHTKFFAFLKKLFYFLLKAKIIAGIKITISGKLKGKLRAKPFNLTVGRVGTSKANSDIDFSKIHIHTLYGCFGFKTLIKNIPQQKYAIRS